MVVGIKPDCDKEGVAHEENVEVSNWSSCHGQFIERPRFKIRLGEATNSVKLHVCTVLKRQFHMAERTVTPPSTGHSGVAGASRRPGGATQMLLQL